MDYYVKLAKKSVEAYIKEGKEIKAPLKPDSGDKNLQAGVFVTIYKGKDLRGCVGTYLPTQKNIAEEIVHNARSAAQDSRFPPMKIEELSKLSYEVSILSEPKPVTDKSKLDPKRDGIIVFSDFGRSGLLLPDLEGVETVEQQIAIACQKGGIDWPNDKLEIFSFQVEKHK